MWVVKNLSEKNKYWDDIKMQAKVYSKNVCLLLIWHQSCKTGFVQGSWNIKTDQCI